MSLLPNETEKKLNTWLRDTENKFCADCLAPGPQWCSLKEGVVLCTKCCGVHRGFTTGGEMRGLVLDTWKPEQFEKLKSKGGNQAVNKILTAYLYPYERISPDTQKREREKFIKKKYLERAYEKPREEKDKPGNRIAYHFLIFSYGEMEKNPNTSQQPRTVFEASFNAVMKDKYPAEHQGVDLPPDTVPRLVFPDACKMRKQNPGSEVRKFVLSDNLGRQSYGVSLVFYEQVSWNDLRQLQKAIGPPDKEKKPIKECYAPKAICVLSAWPFFSQFARFLQTLYRISISESPYPLERFVANFLYRVPVPPRGKLTVQYEIAGESIEFIRAPRNELPYVHRQAEFWRLFATLSVKDIIAVWKALVLETKVVLVSKYQDLRVDCAHTLRSFLFPLHFAGVYIPSLMRTALPVLHSPCPALVGIHPDWIGRDVIPPQCMVVNLDRRTVTHPKDPTLPSPSLPDHGPVFKAVNKLFERLKKSIQSLQASEQKHLLEAPRADHYVKELLPIPDISLAGAIVAKSPVTSKKTRGHGSAKLVALEIIGHFSRFWATVLQDLVEERDPSKGPAGLTFFIMDHKLGRFKFLLDNWLQHGFPHDNPKWFKFLSETMSFQMFIQEREDFETDQKACDPVVADDITLFNELMIKKVNAYTRMKFRQRPTPLLDKQGLEHSQTYTCEQPSDSNLRKKGKYKYHVFPSKLRVDLMHPTTPMNPRWQIQAGGLKRAVGKETKRALGELLAAQRAQEAAAFSSWDQFRGTLIQVQARVRKYLASRRYKATLETVRTLQSRLRARRMADLHQSRFQASRANAIILQAALRGYYFSTHCQSIMEKRVALLLQAQVRTIIAVERHQKRRRMAVVMQATLKTVHRVVATTAVKRAVMRIGSRLQWLHAQDEWLRRRRRICIVQAQLRGVLVRQAERQRIQEKMRECQKELMVLWRNTFTLRSTRAQFLTVFDEPSYLNLAIHEEEVARTRGREVSVGSKSRTEQQQTQLAQRRFEEEAEEMRRTIRALPDDQKTLLFERLGIASNSKKRKVQLLSKLWSDELTPEESRDLTLQIVPQRSINASHSESQCQLRRNQRVQRVLTEIVKGAIQSMTVLHGQVAKTERDNDKLKSKLKSTREELRRERQLNLSMRPSFTGNFRRSHAGYLGPNSILPSLMQSPERRASKVHHRRSSSASSANAFAFLSKLGGSFKQLQ